MVRQCRVATKNHTHGELLSDCSISCSDRDWWSTIRHARELGALPLPTSGERVGVRVDSPQARTRGESSSPALRADLSPQAGRGRKKAGIAPGLLFSWMGGGRAGTADIGGGALCAGSAGGAGT